MIISFTLLITSAFVAVSARGATVSAFGLTGTFPLGQEGYLLDAKTLPSRFYVRLSKTEAAPETFAKKGYDVITLDGEKYKDEFAVVTPEMTGYEFDKLVSVDGELGGYNVLGKIRLVAE